jgi:hypothetical protein
MVAWMVSATLRVFPPLLQYKTSTLLFILRYPHMYTSNYLHKSKAGSHGVQPQCIQKVVLAMWTSHLQLTHVMRP